MCPINSPLFLCLCVVLCLLLAIWLLTKQVNKNFVSILITTQFTTLQILYKIKLAVAIYNVYTVTVLAFL